MTRTEHQIRKEIKTLDDQLTECFDEELEKVRIRIQVLWVELLAARKSKAAAKAN